MEKVSQDSSAKRNQSISTAAEIWGQFGNLEEREPLLLEAVTRGLVKIVMALVCVCNSNL
jgi:hypothetical protein